MLSDWCRIQGYNTLYDHVINNISRVKSDEDQSNISKSLEFVKRDVTDQIFEKKNN